MCLLIVICGLDDDYPILVGGNRDELRTRRASPPGLFVGERHHMLSPRDSVAGGTWMAVGDQGMFAGLTNLSGEKDRAAATSRGRLPHLALDADDLESAVAAVQGEVEGGCYNAFQLVLCDGASIAVVVHDSAGTRLQRVRGPVAVLTNEHRLGEIELAQLDTALAPGQTHLERLERMEAILADAEDRGGHRILKLGGEYGTVSSSLVAVPRNDPRLLVWQYATAPMDHPKYRNYGNLGRRLVQL